MLTTIKSKIIYKVFLNPLGVAGSPSDLHSKERQAMGTDSQERSQVEDGSSPQADRKNLAKNSNEKFLKVRRNKMAA